MLVIHLYLYALSSIGICGVCVCVSVCVCVGGGIFHSISILFSFILFCSFV